MLQNFVKLFPYMPQRGTAGAARGEPNQREIELHSV